MPAVPKQSVKLNLSLSSVGGCLKIFFFFNFWAGGWRPLVLLWRRRSLCLPLRRLAARQGDVAQVEDRERVSLCVEDPALQRHQVVAGEQQVQIPGGGVGWKWVRKVKKKKKVNNGTDRQQTASVCSDITKPPGSEASP